MPTNDRVFDLALAAAALREEAVVTLALVTLARRSLRGERVPQKVRRLLAASERAAKQSWEHARMLDNLLTIADTAKGRGRESC